MSSFPETDWDRVEAVLDAVWDAEPGEREQVLDEQCAGDPALRRDVETLLEADEQSPSFLEQDAVSFAGPAYVEGEAEGAASGGRRIGPYRLVEEVGRGGMSRVFRAKRVDGGFEQEVAVKLLPLGLDTEDARRRFQLERQVLADLQHPSIAQLLDGGITEDGVPFLVMEYVEGKPITDYCDAHRLALEERIDLLCTVGEALQYAHRNLVVHRDLKPSNILVVDTEDGPQVKLLDFGIAKLIDEGAAEETTVLTQTGVRPMTPGYAAPEQMRGGTIRTTTDVYQFGVLAYELLSGHRPFEEHDHIFDIEQAVLDTLPKRPSTVVRSSTGAESPDTVAQARDASVAQLRRTLRGDLDAVVLTALRKEPGDRYASVEAFVADLRRFLDGQPVRVRTWTVGYRVRKFVQRHRWGVGVAVAFVLVVAVSVTMLVRQRNRAQQQARKAERVSAFLTHLFEAADPNRSRGDTVTARMLMRQGRERLDELDDDPAVQAQMMYVLGQTHRRLALYDEARSLLHRSLELRREIYGRTHPDVVQSLRALALFERDQGRYAAADSLLQEVIAVRRTLHGPRDPSVASALMNRTFVQRMLGHYAEAEASIRTALEIHRATHDEPTAQEAEMLFNLAAVLRDQAKYAQAEPIQRRSLTMMQRLADGPHPGVAANLNNLGLLLRERDRAAEADSILRAGLAMNKKLYGPEHPEVATALINLADVNRHLDDYAEAESLYHEAIEVQQAVFGANHPNTVEATVNLGEMYSNRGRLDAADSLYRRAESIMHRAYGPDHPEMSGILRDRGYFEMNQEGSLAVAERLLARSLSIRQDAYADTHPAVGRAYEALGTVHRRQGELGEAVSLYREAYDVFRRASAVDSARVAVLESKLGTTHAELEHYARAESLLQRSYRVLARTNDERAGHVGHQLATLYREWGKPEKAEQYAFAGTHLPPER